MTTEMEDSKCQECSEDIGDRHSGPEESESERELMMFVEVREIQNNLLTVRSARPHMEADLHLG